MTKDSSSGSVTDSEPPQHPNSTLQTPQDAGFISWLKGAIGLEKANDGNSLREVFEEFIEEAEQRTDTNAQVGPHERALISNVLKLRDLTVVDVMIPRADIVAIDVNTSQEDLLALLSQKQFSRLPVYRDSLDDVLGTIHIKDILAVLAKGQRIDIASLVRDMPIVSPAMHVLDLILLMRNRRKHLVLVVDEYGGIDGLATIGDVVEAIVGDIEDEYDQDDEPELTVNKDGSVIADGRYDIDEFQEKFGKILDEEDADDVDTLGGMIFAITGRIPARGEIIAHESGITFEIIDADPRRVNRLLIRNLPLQKAEN
ncbi:MAG: HlyC/CorC family transporter [Micavibrio aeruginosavorus]|uniref:HlyC/CorC family transporter n=1 Tax=Micavibrio aeruginosavorus TaxID=349221 RepID=A0A7T5R4I2_9BACT|nr:MAG: HlyC/CorC family transporter [Micavibrio aeruginosavorus]